MSALPYPITQVGRMIRAATGQGRSQEILLNGESDVVLRQRL